MRISPLGLLMLLCSIPVLLFFGIRWYRVARPANYELTAGVLQQENIVPVAILGDGPAGASAALYASRCDLHPVVFQGPKPGGLLTETGYVENWPAVGKELGQRIMNNLRQQAQEHGAAFVPETITNVDFSVWPFVLTSDSGATIKALSVIIATGAVPRVLGIKGEREYWGKGVTTCAICDAPFFKGKEVVVVGGGDSAIEESTQLAPHVKKVTMFVRKDKLRASQVMQDRLKTLPNVSVRYNVQIEEVMGDGAAVNAIKVLDNKANNTETMTVDGVFLAIGHEPRTGLFAGQLANDAAGYLVMQGRSQQTSVKGVFAAGEVEDHVYRQAGVAAGDGIKAALDAYTFLQEIGFTKATVEQIADFMYRPVLGKAPIKQLSNVAEFDAVLKSSKTPIVIDFYARWCPSCMHMLPVFDAAAWQFEGKIEFCKVDFSVAPELAEKLSVVKVPALLVFKKGELVARYHNTMNKAEMVEFLAQFLDA